MRESMYLAQEGDKERYEENLKLLQKLNDDELWLRYESALKLGIVGSHAQNIYLFALWKRGRERGLSFATELDGGIQIKYGRIISIEPLP
ncbi:MAG: hypothetical protein O3B78_06395 [Bacteroidetes bacterium]|nr:hypothetical protein [Bacteroidota bacterium]